MIILSGAMALAAVLPLRAAEFSSKPGQTQVDAGKLPAGVYDVTFRLQVDRLEQSVTPLAALYVDVPGYPAAQYRQVTPLDFPEANAPVDLVLRLDNWAAQNVAARLEMKKPEAPAPALTVEKITIAPAAGAVIGTVWPGKIIYNTSEEAQAMVSVYNGTGQKQSLTLKTALESDLDRVRNLGATPVKLAPGERQEVPVTWNTGTEQWGFALAATLADAGGKTLDESREYFSVADNLWAVCITQQQRGTVVPFGPGPNPSMPVSRIQEAEKQLAAVLAQPQPPVEWNYGNVNEYYAWAPEDFFNLTPAEDYWYSGTGNYTMGKRHLQMAVEWLHRKGIRATTYTNPFVIGYGAEKVFARHPEWFAYDAKGQLAVGSYYEKKLEVGEHLSEAGPWNLQLSPYAFTCSVNAARLDVIEQQEQQLVKSHYLFGWDGVRFDNTVYGAYGYDWQGRKIDGDDPAKKNAIEQRAWEYLRAHLRQDLGARYGTGTNFDYEFRDRNPAAWDAVCRDGGLLMAEVPRSSYSPMSPNNRWVDYIARYHQGGEAVRALGGHYLTIGLDRHYPVDHLYWSILTYVDRTHPYANLNSDDLPLGNYARFMTRYSALYWDVARVKLLPEAEKRVKIDSPAPLWWKDYACVRQTAEGGKQYLINLVNPPLQERIMTDPTNRVPAPVENVKVSLTVAPGEQIGKAWLLSADPTMTKTALPVSREGNVVTVTVPKVWFWSLVVLE
jgi:hypothetical protein